MMSIANTALGITNAFATVPWPASIAAAAAVAGTGTVQQGIMLANKPRYYYGSRDGSGAYSEIGGNSTGDTVPANVRSGELIVQAGRDAQIAKAALNGTARGMQSYTISAPITINGNADESVLRQIPRMVQQGIASALENNRYRNNFNPALV
jgi:hypothetical protein